MFTMNTRRISLLLLTGNLLSSSNVNAACDLCSGSELGTFNGSNIFPASAGQPEMTCQTMADDMDVTNIEPDSFECIGASLAAALICCGNGGLFTCFAETIAVGTCVDDNNCVDDTTTTVVEDEDEDGDLDVFCSITEADISNEKNNCNACETEFEAFAVCLRKECDGGLASSALMMTGGGGSMMMMMMMTSSFAMMMMITMMM